jgi:hypothetical protein
MSAADPGLSSPRDEGGLRDARPCELRRRYVSSRPPAPSKFFKNIERSTHILPIDRRHQSMRHRSKLMLAALTAALIFGALVSAADANRAATSSQSIRVVWPEITFEGFGEFGTVICRVTLEGSVLSRTISKVAEALIGYANRVSVDEAGCTGGRARANQEGLPWHVRYESFSGSLPNITAANGRFVGVEFTISSSLGITCRYKSTAASPFRGIVSRNTGTKTAERVSIDETRMIPLSSGNGFCPSPATLKGTSNTPTVAGSTTLITVTLLA